MSLRGAWKKIILYTRMHTHTVAEQDGSILQNICICGNIKHMDVEMCGYGPSFFNTKMPRIEMPPSVWSFFLCTEAKIME